MSAILIVLGFSGLRINQYDKAKQTYEQKGVFLTELFNKLKSLYFSVKSSGKTEFTEETKKLSEIEAEYYSNCISKQILLSDWYAHYKFYWQHQIDWIDEQKHFKFWRDKVPLSFVFAVSTVLVALIALVVWK